MNLFSVWYVRGKRIGREEDNTTVKVGAQTDMSGSLIIIEPLLAACLLL